MWLKMLLGSILVTPMCTAPEAEWAEGVQVTLGVGPETRYSDVVTVMDKLQKIGIDRLGIKPEELPAGEFAATVTFDVGMSWFEVMKLSAELRKAGVGRIRFAPEKE